MGATRPTCERLQAVSRRVAEPACHSQPINLTLDRTNDSARNQSAPVKALQRRAVKLYLPAQPTPLELRGPASRHDDENRGPP